ncbi:hypothetical protein ACHAXS_006777, partial [Conticribra weissflogii]
MARWIVAIASTLAFASVILPQDLCPSRRLFLDLNCFCFAFSPTIELASRMTTSSQSLHSLRLNVDSINDDGEVDREPTPLKLKRNNLRSNMIFTTCLSKPWKKYLSTCLATVLLAGAFDSVVPYPSLAASFDDSAAVSAKTFKTKSEKVNQNNPTGKIPLKFSTLSISDSTTTTILNDIENLGLKPPTADRPQIMLNDNLRKVPKNSPQPDDTPATLFLKTSNKKKTERQPILQGLVYFPQKAVADGTISTSSTTLTTETTPPASTPTGIKPKPEVDLYNDILVLTAVSANHPDGPILAGAKFPVADVRFPFQFQMFSENLLINREGVKEAWFGTSSSDGD